MLIAAIIATMITVTFVVSSAQNAALAQEYAAPEPKQIKSQDDIAKMIQQYQRMKESDGPSDYEKMKDEILKQKTEILRLEEQNRLLLKEVESLKENCRK